MFGLMGVARSSGQPGDSGPALLTVPTGFNWTPPINIYRSSAGVYSTDYDPTPFLVEGAPGVTTYYVDSATGSAGNPGTAASPKAALVAISAGRISKLLIKARGKFYGGVTSPIQMGHDELCVEAWGGAACLITTEPAPTFPMVWTDETGGVWSAPSPQTLQNGIAVYSGTDVETAVRYTLAASLAACQATPGTFFRETGPIKHYVHTLDGTSPATGHLIIGTNSSAQAINVSSFAYAQRVQFHGVDFRGGNTAFSILGDSAFTKTIELINCTFKLADNFGALNCSGTSTVITYGCTAGPTRFDGFSYSTASGGVGGNVVKSFEINNIGRNCGITSAANQGSTTHFTGQAVRVNCQYYENANDQVADVGANTRSWNLGCTFGPHGIGTTNYVGVQAGNDGTDVRIWLDGCTFDDVAYEVSAASGGTIYYKNMTAPAVEPSSTGTVTTY